MNAPTQQHRPDHVGALLTAVAHKDAAQVAALLPLVPNTLVKNKALLEAVRNHDKDCVQALLCGGADARWNDSVALRDAAAFLQSDIVDLLIPHSEPQACHNEALRCAVAFGSETCIDLLCGVSDSRAALRYMQKYQSHIPSERLAVLQQRIEAETSKTQLLSEVRDNLGSASYAPRLKM